jgi:glycolate oxidase iron-sulfur subunit
MLQVDAVISLCPTCTHFIKNEYPKIIGAGISNAMDIAQFLGDKPLDSILAQPEERPGTIVYHDPCHSINYLGVKEEPRKILKAMGFGIEEPAERGCCGLGGTVRLLHDDVSSAILANRVKALEGTEAPEMPEMIVTSCPNCVLQLESRIKDRPVKHIIEIIAANIKRRA